MPSKVCPVCNRLQEISQKDWPLVSQMPGIVCSRGCAWEFIEERCSPAGYLRGALQIDTPPPMDTYSDLLGMFFRSLYERYVAEAFSDGGIKFEYERWAFPLKEGVYWTPDFHLPDHRVIVEVKGAWGAGAKTKVKAFTRLYPNVSLLILPWTIKDDFYPVPQDEEE